MGAETPSKVARLREALEDLVGRTCFSAIGGRGVEFAFVLHAGERLLRSLRLGNPRLSFLQRTYEGSHSLLVECTWRIDASDRVLATCLDPAKPAGPRDEGIESLADKKILAVELLEPGLDLIVRFEEDHTLRCFPTEVDEKTKRKNWTYAWPGGMATVAERSRLLLETEEERKARVRPPSVEEEILERWRRLKEERDEGED